jgi:hypothetical protein
MLRLRHVARRRIQASLNRNVNAPAAGSSDDQPAKCNGSSNADEVESLHDRRRDDRIAATSLTNWIGSSTVSLRLTPSAAPLNE